MVIFLLQKNWAPLLIASSNGHLQVVKSLIEAGSNVNQANKVSTHFFSVNYIHTYIIAYINGIHVMSEHN